MYKKIFIYNELARGFSVCIYIYIFTQFNKPLFLILIILFDFEILVFFIKIYK